MTLPPDSEINSRDDKDINELFKNQNINVPPSLDESILAASKAETPTPQRTRRPTFPARWLAVAATVTLAAIIAPLLPLQPEISIEAENHSLKVLDDIPTALPSHAADSPVFMKKDATDQQTIKVLKKPAPRAFINNDSNEIHAIELDLTDDVEIYRLDRESWIKEINRLITTGQLLPAKEEYDLFKAIYPYHSTNITIPEEQ